MSTTKAISVSFDQDQISDVHQVSHIVKDWAAKGVQVKALNYGTGTKRYYPATLDAALTVIKGKEYGGFGVQNGAGGSEVRARQVIELDFDTARSSVKIGLGALFNGKDSATYGYNKKGNVEKAQWIAYSADGTRQATGFVSGTSNGLAQFTIQPPFAVSSVKLMPVGDSSSFSVTSVSAPAVKKTQSKAQLQSYSRITAQVDSLISSMASFTSSNAVSTNTIYQSTALPQAQLVAPDTRF